MDISQHYQNYIEFIRFTSLLDVEFYLIQLFLQKLYDYQYLANSSNSMGIIITNFLDINFNFVN